MDLLRLHRSGAIFAPNPTCGSVANARKPVECSAYQLLSRFFLGDLSSDLSEYLMNSCRVPKLVYEVGIRRFSTDGDQVKRALSGLLMTERVAIERSVDLELLRTASLIDGQPIGPHIVVARDTHAESIYVSWALSKMGVT